VTARLLEEELLELDESSSELEAESSESDPDDRVDRRILPSLAERPETLGGDQLEEDENVLVSQIREAFT
jgi:hypothetical protein